MRLFLLTVGCLKRKEVLQILHLQSCAIKMTSIFINARVFVGLRIYLFCRMTRLFELSDLVETCLESCNINTLVSNVAIF